MTRKCRPAESGPSADARGLSSAGLRRAEADGEREESEEEELLITQRAADWEVSWLQERGIRELLLCLSTDKAMRLTRQGNAV